MGEQVLITGGAGFIGLHLARALLAQGAHVTLVDNFSRGRMDADLRALLPHVQTIEFDLTQPIPDNAFGQHYTQVYHFAAIVGVRYSNEVPHHVLRTNLLTTIHLLDWCMRVGGMTVCFASSSETYAESVQYGLASIPTPEDVPLTLANLRVPRSSYGASKAIGEMLCWQYAQTYAFPLRIVRFHNVYGPRMGYEHVIPQFIERVLDRQDPFAIYGAYQSRAFCYVHDAVAAVLKLMRLDTTTPLIVNVGNDHEEIQIIDLAQRIFTIAGVSPRLHIHAAPPGSPERRSPDLERLRHLTGYQPVVDLAAGLHQTFDWYRGTWEQGCAGDRQGDINAAALHASRLLPVAGGR